MAQAVTPADAIEPMPGAPEDEIELGQVERALAALWAPEPGDAAGTPPGGTPAVLRAAALNLLVLGQSAEELEAARPIAARTTLAHPSRILLLAPELEERRETPGALNSIGARVSAFCHRLGHGGRHVCCEEITLLARGSAVARLPEAVLPLLLPDMPVYLWIPGGRAGDWRPSPDLSRLLALANGVIWSARHVEEHLAPTSSDPHPVIAVDMDWLRTLPWRELTAQLFDGRERGPLLEQLEALEVEIAGPPLPRPGAGRLWLGWLATRLGWRMADEAAADGSAPSERDPLPVGPATAQSGVRRLHGPGGVVNARLVWKKSAAVADGELLAVRLYLRGAAVPLRLERQPAPDAVDLWISDGGGRCIHLGHRDEATLLGEALDRAVPDPIYEAAWQAAVHLWQWPAQAPGSIMGQDG